MLGSGRGQAGGYGPATRTSRPTPALAPPRRPGQRRPRPDRRLHRPGARLGQRSPGGRWDRRRPGRAHRPRRRAAARERHGDTSYWRASPRSPTPRWHRHSRPTPTGSRPANPSLTASTTTFAEPPNTRSSSASWMFLDPGFIVIHPDLYASADAGFEIQQLRSNGPGAASHPQRISVVRSAE